MSDGSWSNQVVNVVVVQAGQPGTGIFLYNGPPGPTTLVEAVTPGPTTDPFGTAVPGGFYSIGLGPANSWLFGGKLVFSNGSSISGTPGGVLLVNGTVGTNAVQVNLPFTSALTAVDPATSVTPESWHSLGTAGSTGLTLEFARYQLTSEGELEIDIALTGGPSTGGTYTWSNTLPAAYTPAGGNFLRVAPMAVNAALAGGVEDAIVAVDCAGAAVPGRVRMTIPNAITANFTCMARFPLN